jgi:hypothetical protein
VYPQARAQQDAFESSYDPSMGQTRNNWHNPEKSEAQTNSDQKYFTETLPELFSDVVEVEAEIIEIALTGGLAGMVEEPGKAIVKQVVKKQVINKAAPKVTMALRTFKEVGTKKVLGKLPSLDATGKVHGTLPKIKDLFKYSKDDLKILADELKQSIQTRIRVTSRMGSDKPHGQRQGAEQDLLKALGKILE